MENVNTTRLVKGEFVIRYNGYENFKPFEFFSTVTDARRVKLDFMEML